MISWLFLKEKSLKEFSTHEELFGWSPRDEKEEEKEKMSKKIHIIELLVNTKHVIFYLILAIRHETWDLDLTMNSSDMTLTSLKASSFICKVG